MRPDALVAAGKGTEGETPPRPSLRVPIADPTPCMRSCGHAVRMAGFHERPIELQSAVLHEHRLAKRLGELRKSVGKMWKC